MKSYPDKKWRKTSQHLIPDVIPSGEIEGYDIYPSLKLEDNLIFNGFESLAVLFIKHRQIIIDGYVGVFYASFREKMEDYFAGRGISTNWTSTSDFLKSPSEVEKLNSPYLGGDDPLFGKLTDLTLEDFFNLQDLCALKSNNKKDINILIGPGAALSSWRGLIVYIDLPKNEVQFRSRAGSITNLGASSPAGSKAMYKRFYFVDWVVLNKHKENILPSINIIIDGQRPDNPVWMTGDTLRQSLKKLSNNLFRVRPWFEPGVWGGGHG